MKFAPLKKARYLIPFIKPLTLGLMDPEDGLVKELADAGLDLLGQEAKEKIKDLLAKEPDAAAGLIDEHLVRHTGEVLAQLVRHYAKEHARENHRSDYLELAKAIPAAWAEFLQSDASKMEELRGSNLFDRIANAVSPQLEEQVLDRSGFIEFIQWTGAQKELIGPFTRNFTGPLADWLASHLDANMLTELCRDNASASASYKETTLRNLIKVKRHLTEIQHEQERHSQETQKHHSEVMGPLLELVSSTRAKNKEDRLNLYKQSLLAAFRPYQELALDNFAAAEQACPDIWDIFVHPACATVHLRPEDMDSAQREAPPRLPAQDLLPILAQDDHRRTVLLADPGMGKSTLIQSLVAHLASGRTLTSAAALNALLPIPLILRDLVPLLSPDNVRTWTWDALINAFLVKYQRDETSLPLCAAFHEHLSEFRFHIANSTAVFFLIDGLDEIGDLVKRRQIVKCIQEGFRAVSQEARWIITSRIIGYEGAPVDIVSAVQKTEIEMIGASESIVNKMRDRHLVLFNELNSTWADYKIKDLKNGWSSEGQMPEELKWAVSEMNEDSKPVAIHQDDATPIGKVWSSITIAQRIYLAPFDDRRQDQFTQRWFQHRYSTDHSQQLMREVRRHHHDGVRIIARVPNLLCLMNILKRSGKPLPDGRAALYDEIVKAYLGGIDAAYRLRPIHGSTCPFDATQRRFLLSLLGAHIQQTRVAGDGGCKDKSNPRSEGNLLISREEICDLLVPIIEPMLKGRPELENRPAAAWLEELLNHIASRSGLLIPRSTDAEGQILFGFTHLSFLEFFAAEWLGREFDRRQRQLARQTEAMQDDERLTSADLELIFPPEGPIIHDRHDFAALAAKPAWHEPLIFLLESRHADAATLLRWLLPSLHNDKPHLVSTKDPSTQPILTLEAVRLAVKLALDTEIALPAQTRRRWWQRLWGAYLDWPYPPWESKKDKRWAIAPQLLDRDKLRSEVLISLASEQPRHSDRPLYLYECPYLTSSDLQYLRGLHGLRYLNLAYCSSLTDIAALAGLQQLELLILHGCRSLEGAGALQGLSGLKCIRHLDLSDCIGIRDTAALAGLTRLKTLSLSGCKGLDGVSAWQGLSKLSSLQNLSLWGCTGLRDTTVLANLIKLETLDLSGCTSLNAAESFEGLSSMECLQTLFLVNCSGFQDTKALSQLYRLESLDLEGCTGLKGGAAMQGLRALGNLRRLDLRGCTGLDKFARREVRAIVRRECEIIWPDGTVRKSR